MVSGGHAQAEELNIVPHKGMTGELRDGMKIATGRIICREPPRESRRLNSLRKR